MAAASINSELILEKMVEIWVATLGMTAPAATATNLS